MAQSEGGAKTSRSVRDAGKKRYKRRKVEGGVYLLRMCANVPLHFVSHVTEIFPARQNPHEMIPKLFGPIAERYKDRQGGYTRVLRIEPLKSDQAPSAILELIDGPKDMRFALTAAVIARCAKEDKNLSDMTLRNIKKVTRFRKDGESELEKMVEKLKGVNFAKK